MELFLDKIMYIILMMSILNTISHGLKFAMSWTNGDKYYITNNSKIFLGLSLSIIITIIITGIKII